MEVRQVNRPVFAFFYLGPGIACAGVLEILPYVTATRWNGGGGYIGIGWLFWSVTLEWRVAKRR